MADKSHESESSAPEQRGRRRADALGAVKPRGRVALRGVDYYAPYWWSVLPAIATGIVAWQLPLEHAAICDQPSERSQRRKAWGWTHPTIFLLPRSTETSDGSDRSLIDGDEIDRATEPHASSEANCTATDINIGDHR